MKDLAETTHRLILADARNMSFLSDESIHLVVTSPPYWTLKNYEPNPNQLGHVEDYEEFLDALRSTWGECLRVLVPGGRLVCVVGDVCLSRREYGRHLVMPLHADICVICRQLGFDNLNPIIWHKIANARYEVSNGSTFLGKPYEPNAIIKNDIEFILMQRKPGGYRQPTARQRKLSMIGKRFSFIGDTVLDPFAGTCSTALSAMKAGRNSICVDVERKYLVAARRRIASEAGTLFSPADIRYEEHLTTPV